MEGVLLAATTCYSGGCFIAGTKIRMADGSLKSIEKIKIGDKVCSYDPKTGNLASDLVDKVFFKNITQDGYIEINKTLNITKAHPINTYQFGSMRAGDLSSEDILTGYQYTNKKISSIRAVPGTYKVYNILTVHKFGFFAEDYLVF
jgi:hypothetical protein